MIKKISALTQTDECLMYFQFEDKLTKIHQHIRALKQREDFYKLKNQYLEYKNKILMNSLLQTEQYEQIITSKKRIYIINDLEKIQKQIDSEIKSIVALKLNDKKYSHRFIQQNNLQIKQNSKIKTFKEQKKQNLGNILKSKNGNQINKITKIENQKKLNEEIQNMKNQIVKLQKQIKQLKLQNYRVFQMNDDLKIKIKKLKKMVQYQQKRYEKELDRMQAKINIQKFKSQILTIKQTNKTQNSRNSECTLSISCQVPQNQIQNNLTKRLYQQESEQYF